VELEMFTQGVYKSPPLDYLKPRESIPHFYILMITLPSDRSHGLFLSDIPTKICMYF